MNDAPAPHGNSPWRQPILWLVLALPAIVVVAGIWMIVIASDDGATDAVATDVQRMAQVQTVDLGPDAVARNERLSAIVRTDEARQWVEVLPVSGSFDRRAPLHLVLQHPTLASGDVRLQLAPSELGWRVEANVDSGHDWNARLQPSDGRWRLHGRWPAGQQATNLRPSLRAE